MIIDGIEVMPVCGDLVRFWTNPSQDGYPQIGEVLSYNPWTLDYFILSKSGERLYANGEQVELLPLAETLSTPQAEVKCCELEGKEDHYHCKKCSQTVIERSWPFCPHPPLDNFSRDALTSAPIVYWTDKKGVKYFAPDAPHSKCIKHEVHFSQKEKFYKELSADNQRKFNASQEREEARSIQSDEGMRRNYLRERFRGNPAMREALERKFATDDKRREDGRRYSSDSYCQAFEYDSSNREPARGDDGIRLRD